VLLAQTMKINKRVHSYLQVILCHPLALPHIPPQTPTHYNYTDTLQRQIRAFITPSILSVSHPAGRRGRRRRRTPIASHPSVCVVQAFSYQTVNRMSPLVASYRIGGSAAELKTF